uniref:carbohydrate-binding family 9-like protein n=1 Tax=Candidatus Fimivicinus sp. TaxID=3056640 RepID=UPI003FEF4EFB
MAQSYAGPIFDGSPDWARVPIARLESFHWEGDAPYRPASFAQLCAVRGKGVFVRMWSFEEPVRAVACERDDPVYKDSCLECFLNPFPALQNAYLNFEMNPKGVFLTEFGPGREGRVRLSKMTDWAPVVTPFSLSTPQGDAWGVLLLIPVELIEAVYGRPFPIVSCTMAGNFYKCGDETERPHFGAYFPVGSAALGFHNPQRFGTIELIEEATYI